jgi:hypothetical protein
MQQLGTWFFILFYNAHCLLINRCSKFGPHCLLEHDALLCQLYWRKNTYLSFLCRFLNLSFSILSAISVSPSLHLPPYFYISPLISIFLPISISLSISISLAISISLHYTENKVKMGVNSLLHFAYSWGHCLKIMLYSAETEKH